MDIIPLQSCDIESIAHLHAVELNGDFLPSLGEPFLCSFYRLALADSKAFGFIQKDRNLPVGFIFGNMDTKNFFRNTLRRSGFVLGWATIPAILRQPHLILNVFETIFYPRRESLVAVSAELLVIAVETSRQGNGIGEKLVHAFNNEIRLKGATSYKVTALQSNQKANSFYQRLGFRLAGQFTLYHKAWNLYIFDLDQKSQFYSLMPG